MAYEIHQTYATDQYGGFTDLPVSGGATGFFRLGQIGDRWTFVTPEGNAFLYKGIMVWSPVGGGRYEPNLKRKYGGGSAREAGRYTPYVLFRMAQMLGINTIGWGTGIYHFPVNFLGQGKTVELFGCGFPMLPNHGCANPAVATSKRAKDILRTGTNDGGVKIAAWASGGNRRACVDMGDPHFGPVEGLPLQATNAVKESIDKRKGEFVGFDIAQSPWLHSNSIDDADYFFGHKGGYSIHPGWIAAVTSPYQVAHADGTVYDGLGGRTDGVVYCKQRARNYLQQKYGTIQALNTAWGSNYTTFDSSNPSDPLLAWQSGTGTGFLDEDGVTHSWIKVNTTLGVWQWSFMSALQVLPPQVKVDLDEVMEDLVETLYKQYAVVFRAEYPNHLLAGPSALKHTLGHFKPGVLRAAGRVFDYLHMDYTPPVFGKTHPNESPPQSLTDLYGLLPTSDVPADIVRSYNISGLPIHAWKSAVVYQGHDSAAAHQQGTGGWAGMSENARARHSQVAKGALFDENLEIMLSAVGADGKKFWLGFDNWSPIDQHLESINWGFMTETDNAYDGKQTQVFGIGPSTLRKHACFPGRRLQMDETGHPCTRATVAVDNSIAERYGGRFGDSITLIRAATRRAEFHWLSLTETEVPPEPPVVGRRTRMGGATRVGGRNT